MSSISVEFFPHQSHCYAFGGFEVQMLDLMSALRDTGTDCRLHDPWSRNQVAPIVHHFGLGGLHLENMYWAKKSGLKIVATALFAIYDTIGKKMRNRIGRLCGPTRDVVQSLKLVDHLIVVNEIDRDTAIRYFGVLPSRVSVIPNMVPDVFYETTSQVCGNVFVSIGNICKRKNQLNLIRAVKGLPCELVIVGKSLANEIDYYNHVLHEISLAGNVRLQSWLDREGGDYMSLLARSRGLCLLSEIEQGPIVALEMGAMGKQVILGDKPYARQQLMTGCGRAKIHSEMHIRSIISEALASDEVFKLNPMTLQRCRPASIAAAQNIVYNNVLRA
jgi:glycosyltransferase involved in cell wall biosynthesis